MGKKIFISYKYADDNVMNIRNQSNSTVRDYVDEIMKNRLHDSDIYKGEEDGNDLSQFKDEKIKTHLKDKIHDSSIILVLISPSMKTSEPENTQWIPWEISYSLKEITRDGKTSGSNGIVAVILPDSNNSYEYFIQDAKCGPGCCIRYQTKKTFEIIAGNMFNKEDAPSGKCGSHENKKVYYSEDSYIELVKWEYFKSDPQKYINNAEEKRKNIKQYDIQKEVFKDSPSP